MDELYHAPNLVAVYDTLNDEREDFDFYLSQLLAPPAKVADLGCGTGTFAIELAHLGYQVVGIEPATPTLARARIKGGDAVCWIEGTIADVPETERFNAIIMTGHAFQCLLRDTDIENLFSEVGRRLVPGGAFLFETRNPAARAWDRCPPPEQAGAPRPLPDGRLVRVVHEVERGDVGGRCDGLVDGVQIADVIANSLFNTVIGSPRAPRIQRIIKPMLASKAIRIAELTQVP